jgi:hypothetical protein
MRFFAFDLPFSSLDDTVFRFDLNQTTNKISFFVLKNSGASTIFAGYVNIAFMQRT